MHTLLRRFRVGVALAATIVAGVPIGSTLYSALDGQDYALSAVSEADGLKPLPIGPPSPRLSHGLIERVTLEEMKRTADVVFVGTVREIGGSEPVTISIPQKIPILTRHRTRFDVEQALRGVASSPLDISLLDIGNVGSFVQGMRYLVFAEPRHLGETRTPGLVPQGYFQGMLAMIDSDRATNPYVGTVSTVELKRELEGSNG